MFEYLFKAVSRRNYEQQGRLVLSTFEKYYPSMFLPIFAQSSKFYVEVVESTIALRLYRFGSHKFTFITFRVRTIIYVNYVSLRLTRLAYVLGRFDTFYEQLNYVSSTYHSF